MLTAHLLNKLAQDNSSHKLEDIAGSPLGIPLLDKRYNALHNLTF